MSTRPDHNMQVTPDQITNRAPGVEHGELGKPPETKETTCPDDQPVGAEVPVDAADTPITPTKDER